MSIADKTVLATGGGRGIGQALADEALRRGARRVNAAARRPAAHPDERVAPLRLDVVDAARKAGATWNQIGACYGLTKQGTQQRFRAARNQAKTVTAAAGSTKAEPAA